MPTPRIWWRRGSARSETRRERTSRRDGRGRAARLSASRDAARRFDRRAAWPRLAYPDGGPNRPRRLARLARSGRRGCRRRLSDADRAAVSDLRRLFFDGLEIGSIVDAIEDSMGDGEIIEARTAQLIDVLRLLGPDRSTRWLVAAMDDSWESERSRDVRLALYTAARHVAGSSDLTAALLRSAKREDASFCRWPLEVVVGISGHAPIESEIDRLGLTKRGSRVGDTGLLPEPRRDVSVVRSVDDGPSCSVDTERISVHQVRSLGEGDSSMLGRRPTRDDRYAAGRVSSTVSERPSASATR